MSRLSSIHESELANDDTQKSNLQSKSVSTPALNNPVKQRAKTAPNSQANQLKVVCLFLIYIYLPILMTSITICLLLIKKK